MENEWLLPVVSQALAWPAILCATHPSPVLANGPAATGALDGGRPERDSGSRGWAPPERGAAGGPVGT
jgi:hypothetical protein